MYISKLVEGRWSIETFQFLGAILGIGVTIETSLIAKALTRKAGLESEKETLMTLLDLEELEKNDLGKSR